MASHPVTLAIVLSFIYFVCSIRAQQPYATTNCPANDSTPSILGYNCTGVNRTCQSFLIYRTQPPYNTISSIASLLSANASQMSVMNNISENLTLQTNNEVIIPVTCSCTGRFHQVNTTYVVQTDDTYYTIANYTFKGLTTCNAIRMQKVSPNIVRIFPDERLIIPLRCACPTRRQVNEGIRYLMSYVIERGNTVASIAINFEADVGQTLEANELPEDSTIIQPFTTLLVPLRNQPNTTRLVPLRNSTNGSRMNNTENGRSSSNIAVAVSVPIVIVVLFMFGACFCIYHRKGKKPSQDMEEFNAVESLRFDFKTIRSATENFSERNKLGQGGFGGVYKGILQNGQQVAVKRLSTNSGQGIEEFKTEVLLVEKLQHKNLVKLLGFCLHGEEKLLVYELLPNASLDKVLLGINRRPSLSWEARYNILLGTARGLLYLHEDSRLKIIHRDLKMSNILLDENMNAKIADFGLARLVGRDQIHADTSRIAGTYGYMAPEYALTGRFSIMSDVYSFGVIALEIVSGHMCSSTTFPYEDESLCQRAWRLWKNDVMLELVDPRLDGNFISDEVTRCIHIGLLCIQENANKRPTMAPIVSALNGHHIVLPEPEPPQLGPPTIFHNGCHQEGPKSSINVSKSNDDFTEIYPR